MRWARLIEAAVDPSSAAGSVPAGVVDTAIGRTGWLLETGRRLDRLAPR